MADKFNPESFAPFLEAMRHPAAMTGPEPRPSKTATEPALQPANRSAMAGPGAFDLLKILADAPEKRIEVSTFLKQSGLGLDAFQRALHGFEAASLISLLRPAGGPEEVALTPAGEQIASLSL
jgi:hypothetical protein